MCSRCETADGRPCICGEPHDPAGEEGPCGVRLDPAGTCERCGHVAAAAPSEIPPHALDRIEGE